MENTGNDDKSLVNVNMAVTSNINFG